MARVRNHAEEYARIKARAEAAGLSTRAFRRARKTEPEKYYAPRALAAKHNRERIVQQIQRAHESRGETVSQETVQKQVNRATPEQRDKFSRTYKQWEVADSGDADSGDVFWLDDEDYDDLGALMYYHG